MSKNSGDAFGKGAMATVGVLTVLVVAGLLWRAFGLGVLRDTPQAQALTVGGGCSTYY